jgi:anaerobic magnesium-protoporphyrin IX monomethyl ester cyclase
MRILLINPPVDNVITSAYPKCFHHLRGVQPPLGLLYLASYLNKINSALNIKVFDACAEYYSLQNLKELICDFKPDVVGVQIFSFTLIDSLDVLKTIKENYPEIYTVAGGPHVTLFPEETMSFSFVDFAVIGEGEIPFSQLVQSIAGEGIGLNSINGIAYRENSELFIDKKHNNIECLDDIPIINRKLLPYKKYSSVFSRNSIMTAMITSRGCPYHCVYCSNFNHKPRAHSAEYVIQEIKNCVDLGINEIFIIDDTFSYDMERAKSICKGIIKNKIELKWYVNTRINTMDEELLGLLKQAGCRRVNYGIESGSQKIINNIKKGIKLEKAKHIIRKTKAAGLDVYCFFMIGLPGETMSDIKQTIKFVKETKPDFAQFSVTTIEPGTELYNMALNTGIIKYDVWREFALNPKANFISPVWTENFDSQELYNILSSMYKRYYLSPRFIIRNVFNRYNWLNFSKTVSAIIRVAKM